MRNVAFSEDHAFAFLPSRAFRPYYLKHLRVKNPITGEWQVPHVSNYKSKDCPEGILTDGMSFLFYDWEMLDNNPEKKLMICFQQGVDVCVPLYKRKVLKMKLMRASDIGFFEVKCNWEPDYFLGNEIKSMNDVAKAIEYYLVNLRRDFRKVKKKYAENTKIDVLAELKTANQWTTDGRMTGF
ncbi:MAG: hypothetical protein Q8K92_08415 [Leadbetterella sp.]|nr:hypothetical protein [Leadbetterella sp.]